MDTAETNINGKAPTSHAVSATTYGSATASLYGHVKLSDTYASAVSSGAAANGIGASQNALYNAYNALNTAIGKKLSLAGGTLTGTIKFPKNTVCDYGGNVYFGDTDDLPGAFKIKGISGSTCLLLSNMLSNDYGCIHYSYNSSMISGDMSILANIGIRLMSPFVSVETRDGSIHAPIYASSFNTSSSKRYKKNIKDMTDEEGKQILKLRPVHYDYINENEGNDCLGLIAEEVAEINDYPVSYKNGLPDGIDYSKLVPQLIKCVQMLNDRITELEKTNATEDEK